MPNLTTSTAVDTFMQAANQAAMKAALGGVGILLDSVATLSSTTGSTTATIPLDNTIPQSSEGAAFAVLSTTITPLSATSTLLGTLIFPCCGSKTMFVIASVFRDAGTNAIAAGLCIISAATFDNVLVLQFSVASGSTAATTFSVRYGPDSANGGTAFANQNSSLGALFGGEKNASLIIQEIGP